MQGKSRLLKFISALLAVCILLPLSLSPSAAADVAGEDSSASSGSDAGATITETLDYEESKLETYPEIIAGKAGTDHIERLAYKEDMNTLVYANADGTETMYLFDCAVKYIDNNGNIKDKSTLLVSTEDGFANRDNDIAVSFSGDASGGTKVSYKGIELTLIPQSTSKDISKAALSALAVPDDDERERVVYASAFADAKLVYTPTFEGFKEDIVVDKYNGVTEYSFRLLTNGAVLKDNVLYCDGKEAAQLGDIIVIDSEGQIDIGSIKAETVKEGSEYLLTVCVNADFMKSAVYPVYIDPSFKIEVLDYGPKNIEDAPIYSNNSDINGGFLSLLSASAPLKESGHFGKPIYSASRNAKRLRFGGKE